VHALDVDPPTAARLGAERFARPGAQVARGRDGDAAERGGWSPIRGVGGCAACRTAVTQRHVTTAKITTAEEIYDAAQRGEHSIRSAR